MQRDTNRGLYALPLTTRRLRWWNLLVFSLVVGTVGNSYTNYQLVGFHLQSTSSQLQFSHTSLPSSCRVSTQVSHTDSYVCLHIYVWSYSYIVCNTHISARFPLHNVEKFGKHIKMFRACSVAPRQLEFFMLYY